MEEELKKIEKKLENNTKKIITNMNKLHSHDELIHNNEEKIQKNSYALDILRDYKRINRKQMILTLLLAACWLVTLVILLFK